jgi:hypothetical protein
MRRGRVTSAPSFELRQMLREKRKEKEYGGGVVVEEGHVRNESTTKRRNGKLGLVGNHRD